ncbi:hypothetical protein V2J09_018478 [Rumex salicifolius]
MQAWIRFTNLPVLLYEEQILLHLAFAIGAPIRVDKRTLHANRGRFARMCIKLDLSKLLIGAVIINGSRFLVEYEGLHSICFHCGRFGHFQPNCPLDPMNIAKKEAMLNNMVKEGKRVEQGQEADEKYGVWMNYSIRRRAQQRRSRVGVKQAMTQEKSLTEQLSLSDRFATLAAQIDKPAEMGVGTQSMI